MSEKDPTAAAPGADGAREPGWASRAGRMELTRKAVTGAIQELQDPADGLFQLAGRALSDFVGEVDELVVRAEAARFAAILEADVRGEVCASDAGSLRGWIARYAPGLTGSAAGALARLVTECRKPANAQITAAVMSGRVRSGLALTVIAEFDRLRPLLVEGADEPVAEALLALAEHGDAKLVRRLRPTMLAKYGRDGELDAEQDTAARQRTLSQPRDLAGGLWEYQLITDTEGRAVLEAALGPLSAPQPAPDGAPDDRTPGQRRGDALIEIARRAAAMHRSGVTERSGGAEPGERERSGGAGRSGAAGESAGADPIAERLRAIGRGTKAVLHVSMTLADLVAGLGSGTVLGSTADGELLSPAIVRRMACDARIVPMVLGSRGELLDLGRSVRLVSGGQWNKLLIRDRHCSYPGCDVPAFWCDAHHLRHWADQGATDIDNLTLLCGRHHSQVHQMRLHGALGPDGVSWDRWPGSYDRALDAATGRNPGERQPPGREAS